jgi:5,6,7,8-tetrahydromethanopterin hydro-lyase
VPQALHDVLEKALEDEKDDRYQTAGEFKDALRATAQTATQPIQKPAAELGAGECPKCHTRNESSRKFCQGCGGSLRLSCLSCDEQIPVWDNFCSECGGKQSELIASKLEELASQREQAEEYRREDLFEDALQIARSLASMEDERLAEHVPWAVEFVTATEAAWERERESAAAHFEEARKHRDAFDYASAIHAVESVPEAMRTSEVSGYLQHLESDRAESEELIKTISDRVKRRDLKGLLEQVERAVELRGDRTDLQKLAEQLREREEKRQQQRDEACNEAKRLFDIGDAKGALAMIQSVPSEDLRSSDEPLRSQLGKIVAAEDKLTALVQESKADGVLDPDEVVSMWQATVSYLKLNPRHEKIAGLQQQLEARIQKAPEKYAAFTELAVLWRNLTADEIATLPTEVVAHLPIEIQRRAEASRISVARCHCNAGTGYEAASIDLVIGRKDGPAGEAFLEAFIAQGVGRSNLLAMLEPNLLCKPATLMVPQVALQGAADCVRMFGPAQYGIARAVSDCVAMGVIPRALAEDCVCVCNLVVDSQATEDSNIANYNYEAMCMAITKAMRTPHLDLRMSVRNARLPCMQFGEALVGEGNEVAHIDLVVGSKTGPVGAAYIQALSNSDPQHPSLTAESSSGRPCKPDSVLLTKVTLKSPRQNTQIHSVARRAVAQAVEDCVMNGTISDGLSDDLAVLCAIFIHWDATDDKKIYEYNYEATRLSIQRAMLGEPSIDEVITKKDEAVHPFYASDIDVQ